METKLITKLQDKEYRDAFIASQINIELPFQVRALREERGWTQNQLAEKAGMAQPRISAIETPGKGKLNLDTLLRLASAFDVGLIVRFAPFSEIIEWVEGFSPDIFSVKSFVEYIRSSSSAATIQITGIANPISTPQTVIDTKSIFLGEILTGWSKRSREKSKSLMGEDVLKLQGLPFAQGVSTSSRIKQSAF